MKKTGRLPQALDQYQRAAALDPSYRAAVEAVERLSKTVTAQPAFLTGDGPVMPASSHLLSESGDDPGIGAPGVIPPPPPTDAQQGKLPDLSDLEARTRENDRKAREAQMKMTKAGTIYGAIAGILVWGILGIPALITGNALSVIIPGAVIGIIIGFIIGYTCGDEWTGLKVGAGIGALGYLISILPRISETPGIAIVSEIMVRGAIMAFLGWVIGIIVDRSIGS